MLLDYHELAVDAPKQSPAQRQQFLVVCTIMVGGMTHAFLNAGGLYPIKIDSTSSIMIFPGGNFLYKQTQRDYAAAGSLVDAIAIDVSVPRLRTADRLYAAFFDDPSIVVGGRQQRFAVGYLAATPTEVEQVFPKLLAQNARLIPPSEEEIIDLGADELWNRLPYQTATLPAAKAAVVHFPFTNGFISAMMFTYRVLPALRQYASQNAVDGDLAAVTVWSTCSIEEQMCTHYAPLDQKRAFLLGQPDSQTYAKMIGASSQPWINFKILRIRFKKVFEFFDFFSLKTKPSNEMATEL